MYIHIHMYMCVYIYIYTCMYIHMQLSLSLYIYIYICFSLRVFDASVERHAVLSCLTDVLHTHSARIIQWPKPFGVKPSSATPHGLGLLLPAPRRRHRGGGHRARRPLLSSTCVPGWHHPPTESDDRTSPEEGPDY